MSNNFEVKVFNENQLNQKVAVVVGTRPGIVMFAPIIHSLIKNNIPHFVIHTGQHYSPNMDSQLFEDLNLPSPDYRIERVAEKKTHGGQTAVMLEGIEKVLIREQPKLILVGGDANTNLAGALAARKLRIQVGHVEAGERSFDWSMPEEHNRVIIDHISEYLFVTGQEGKKNLIEDGIRGEIFITGNPIVDASIQHFELAKNKSTILKDLGIEKDKYFILTMHREENVDFKEKLESALVGVSRVSQEYNTNTVFLAHPRTLKRLKEFNLLDMVHNLPGIKICEALRYLDFLAILGQAKLVFTDSGGVQQEACIHRKPCITLRENTEWIETLEIGANRLAGCNPDKIMQVSKEAIISKMNWEIPFGDGKSADYITDIVKNVLEE